MPKSDFLRQMPPQRTSELISSISQVVEGQLRVQKHGLVIGIASSANLC